MSLDLVLEQKVESQSNGDTYLAWIGLGNLACHLRASRFRIAGRRPQDRKIP